MSGSGKARDAYLKSPMDHQQFVNFKSTIIKGPGKLTAPLSAYRNVVSATLRFLQEYVSAFCRHYDVSVGVMLVWYQQAGSGGKYVDVSRKWSCYFTLTLSSRLHGQHAKRLLLKKERKEAILLA
jgi:hypothetical protein